MLNNPVSPAQRSPRGQKAERPGPCRQRAPTDGRWKCQRGAAGARRVLVLPQGSGPGPASPGPALPATATAFPQEGPGLSREITPHLPTLGAVGHMLLGRPSSAIFSSEVPSVLNVNYSPKTWCSREDFPSLLKDAVCAPHNLFPTPLSPAMSHTGLHTEQGFIFPASPCATAGQIPLRLSPGLSPLSPATRNRPRPPGHKLPRGARSPQRSRLAPRGSEPAPRPAGCTEHGSRLCPHQERAGSIAQDRQVPTPTALGMPCAREGKGTREGSRETFSRNEEAVFQQGLRSDRAGVEASTRLRPGPARRALRGTAPPTRRQQRQKGTEPRERADKCDKMIFLN